MKMIDKKIIEYLDGTLSEAGREKFEFELNSSAELRNELAKYKKTVELVEVTKDISADGYYFGKIIPKFRSKTHKRLKFFVPRYAYAFAVSAAAFIITFNFWNGAAFNSNENIFTEDKSYNLLYVYPAPLDQYNIPDDLIAETDSLISSEIRNELLASATNAGSYLQDDYYSLIGNLDEQQAELLYEELLSKEKY